MVGDELGKRDLIARGAALDECGLAATDLRPTDRAGLLHGDHSNQFRPRPAPKVPARAPALVGWSSVKRVLIAMALLAVTAVGAAVVYQSTAREDDYRQLIAQGDA